ncbi:hypothetical protein ABQF34_23380 [Mycolicibacterium boenickei]
MTRTPLRQARWWLIACALLLIGSGAALYVGGQRIAAWVHRVERDCTDAWPAAPNLTAAGWTAIGLTAVAMLALVVGLLLVLTGANRQRLKVAATLAGLGVFALASYLMLAGFADATVPVDRYTVAGSDGGALCPTTW